MFPFGILREPVKCIGRADFVIFTKDNLINPNLKFLIWLENILIIDIFL